MKDEGQSFVPWKGLKDGAVPSLEIKGKYICPLCEWPVEDWECDMVKDGPQPYICNWCGNRTMSSIGTGFNGLGKPSPKDFIWSTGAGLSYRRALAVFHAIDRELMKIRFQKRTGKQGDHIRWKSQTKEQRKAWENQPAPKRAWMR